MHGRTGTSPGAEVKRDILERRRPRPTPLQRAADPPRRPRKLTREDKARDVIAHVPSASGNKLRHYLPRGPGRSPCG